MTVPASPRWAAFDASLEQARQLRRQGQLRAAFAQLERAHVLGQLRLVPHLRVHLAMLGLAWALRDGREWRGQLLRIALTPLGHLSGRLPLGNTGGADVSAFAPMPIAPDLARLMNPAAPLAAPSAPASSTPPASPP